MAADGRLLIAVALALILLPQVIAGVIAPPRELGADSQGAGGTVLVLIAALLSMVGQLALIRLALQSQLSVGEAIGHGLRRLPVLLAALIILGCALVVLAFPLLLLLTLAGAIPAEGSANYAAVTTSLAAVVLVVVLAFAPKFQMVMPIVSAERLGPIAVLKRSWTLSKGHYWQLLGFILLLLVAAILLVVPAQLLAGVFAQLLAADVEPMSIAALIYALVVGVAQTALVILASLMLAAIYAQLAGEDALEPSVPSTAD